MNKKYLGGLAILIIGVCTFIFLRKNPGSEVVCTMEALQCPNGLYVGRSGPLCEFTACSGVEFVGTLVSRQSDFVLHTDAPKEGTQEVVYVLPLVVSGDMSQYVGARVKVSGVFVAGNTFKVASIEKLNGIASDAHRGEVRVGQSVLIQGVRITLRNIVQDSRCPVDVQCIQAGNVTAEVELQSNTDKDVVRITSGKSPVLFDTFNVSIDMVIPTPSSNKQINQDEYRIVFKVE